MEPWNPWLTSSSQVESELIKKHPEIFFTIYMKLNKWLFLNFGDYIFVWIYLIIMNMRKSFRINCNFSFYIDINIYCADFFSILVSFSFIHIPKITITSRYLITNPGFICKYRCFYFHQHHKFSYFWKNCSQNFVA